MLVASQNNYIIMMVKFCQKHLLQGLSHNASSVSFGHAEHCFLTVWTPIKFMSEFAEDDFS